MALKRRKSRPTQDLAFFLQVVDLAAQEWPDKVRALVKQQTEGRFLGVLGEPRVNVLQLNMALDAMRS